MKSDISKPTSPKKVKRILIYSISSTNTLISLICTSFQATQTRQVSKGLNNSGNKPIKKLKMDSKEKAKGPVTTFTPKPNSFSRLILLYPPSKSSLKSNSQSYFLLLLLKNLLTVVEVDGLNSNLVYHQQIKFKLLLKLILQL